MNEPTPEALQMARKIAAEIDVEHDDTMQDKCRVCQRVIPFIALAIDRAVAQERERCAKIAQQYSGAAGEAASYVASLIAHYIEDQP